MYKIELFNADDINLKKLCRHFIKYKRKSLKNQGENPLGKKHFKELFYSIISNSAKDFISENLNYFFVIKEKNNIIGFTSISLKSKDVVDIPYDYGEVKDFYIAPKYRRKGFGRVLNDYIEDVFVKNKTNVVLLSPDPVSGIDFWRAMGYIDTGIHKGWGKHFVYIKHITDDKTSLEIVDAISELLTPTDLIGINPYNKPQMKEVYCVWKEYCKELNQKQHRNDIKKMAWNARKHKNISFRAVYYKGKIIGFKYNADDEINYVLPEYRNTFKKGDDNESMEIRKI